MNIYSNITHPTIFILVGIITLLILVFGLYFFKINKDEFTRGQRIALSIIKSSYWILITALLLSLIVETIKIRKEKPILIVGVDNSESIINQPSNSDQIHEIIRLINTSLNDKFQIETLLFGDRIEKSDSATFNNQKSNYSNLFTEIDKRYFNMNVGALVLLGDGIYNEGKNPEQYSPRVQVPIYSVGIGDTTVFLDQAIVDITHNSNVFINNTFPVEIETNFKEFPNQKTQLSVYIDGRLVHSENIEIPQPNYYFKKTLDLKADKIGLRNIQVSLRPLTSEQNTQNNSRRFTIEVHDNKKEVLVLTQGPHPDIGSIAQTLNTKSNFDVDVEKIDGYTGNMDDYDLIILNQLPSLRTQHLDIFEKIKNKKIPLLLIIGPNTSISALNNLQLDFQMNPTLLSEESTPFFNQSFSLFSIPENMNEVEKVYPPLLTHFTEISYGSQYSVLAYQRINQLEMNYPLILAGEINQRKTGIIFGEGIWRWRFHEYQNYNNQKAFNQLLTNLFNYISLKDDRDQFKLQYQRICSETAPVKFKAQVFNEIYESVNNAEISLIVIDSLRNELNYVFDVNQNNYNLNIGLLSPGNYSFTSTATLGKNTFIKNGTFNVQEVNIEQQNLQSNFKTLNYLSVKSGGEFYFPTGVENLLSELLQAPQYKDKSHSEKNINEVIDWKWFLMIIILLLSLEWFLRKFWGSY